MSGQYIAEQLVRNLNSKANVEFVGKYTFRYYQKSIDPEFLMVKAYCFITEDGIDAPKFYTVYPDTIAKKIIVAESLPTNFKEYNHKNNGIIPR